MAVDVIFVAVGLLALGNGADVLVRSAARLAVHLDISADVIGAVIVGFGTGVPELIVSSRAAARGSLDIAGGNVVGSNLANLTLVLGFVGIISRPTIVPRIVRREAPLSLAAVALLALLLQDGLTRWEGAVLIVAFGAAVSLILQATEPGEHPLPDDVAAASLRPIVLRLVVGLVATVGGA